jgi:hypothetical protein
VGGTGSTVGGRQSHLATAGDHDGFLLNPVEVHAAVGIVPLPFSAVRDLDASHPA